MKKVFLTAAACAVVTVLSFGQSVSDACVGKTLHLGRLPGMEQEILAELFTWLVNERTGTSIKVKVFEGDDALRSALEKAEIDVYLEGTAAALREALERDAPGSSPSSWQAVRKEYERRYNLIWLEPWGTSVASGSDAPLVSLPVIRKDTVKKFPALSRLLNKMGGMVDEKEMERLVAESSRKTARAAAKDFLKQKKLI